MLRSLVGSEMCIRDRKRLAAAQGIDVLNLVKSMQEIQEEQQEVAAQQQQLEETKQTANLLKAPLLDPTKNPQLAQTPPQ